jgi:hypothetical protein
MQTFPRFTASTIPRGSGLARAGDISTLTATSDYEFLRSLDDLGQSLGVAGDFVFKVHQNRKAIDADLQYKKAKADVYEFSEKYIQLMEDTPVISDDQRRELHKNYMRELNIINRQRNKEIDNKDALTARESDWPIEQLSYSKDMYSYLTVKLHKHQKESVLSIGESLIKDGRIDEAKKHFNYHVKRGLISQANVDKFIAERETYYKAKKILAEKGYQASTDFVMSKDIDTDIKKNIISDINFEASQQKQQLELQREQDRDEISKLIRSGQSATSAIENSFLDEKEQWTWFERERAEAERLAKGEVIETNQFIKGDLETMAYSIHDGSVKMPDFLRELHKVRYDDKNIDDSAYDSLLTIAQNKYESYQSKEMSSRIAHAKTQLVTYGDELSWIETLRKLAKEEQVEATRERQLQLDNLDRYRRALYDWFENQRAQKKYPTATEIYTEGRRLLAHYSRSTEELRREEAARRVKQEKRSRAKPYKIGEIVTKGGRKYKIVGFDTDGEPLVEPK